jgi:LPS export ABC transporter protein LptC
MTQQWTAHLRRAALWAVPGALVAALVWSFLPRGGDEQVTPPPLPALREGQVRSAPAAASGGGATAAAPSAVAPNTTSSPGGAPAAPQDTSPPGSHPAASASAPPQAPTRALSGGVAAGEIKLGNLVGTDDKGHMRWKIMADDMILQQAAQLVELRNVRATLFNEDGTHMLVSGDRGTYDTRTREITVDGAVHGVTSTGRELFADVVSYSPQSREVEGRGHVRVIEERVIMFADRMTSDLQLGQTRFFGNVHMTLR